MKKVYFLPIVMVMLLTFNAFGMDMDKMKMVLEKTRQDIDSTFFAIDNDLSAAAKELSTVDLKGEEARKIVRKLIENKSYVIDGVIVDTAGKMIVIEPQKYRKAEGTDISAQAHTIALMKDKLPVLSGLLLSNEGIVSIVFAYPIFSANGDLLGSVNMLVKQDALTKDIIVGLLEGMPCKVWIMQKDGWIIYDEDPNQIALNILSDESYLPFKQLIEFSRTVSQAKDGGGSYDFYAAGLGGSSIVKKYAVWDTVSLYGTEWRIIVMEAGL